MLLRERTTPGLRRYARRVARPALLGTLRRTTPLSDVWGGDRGTPVDRYYIERFLERHRRDVRGRVVEILNDDFTARFGTGVERSDVLDIDASNPRATLVADLAAAHSVPSDAFDCFILTQTLQLIYDARAAVGHVHRVLRPGGVLLATVPFISRTAYDDGPIADYWRFSAAACRRLFGEVFGEDQVEVETYGNVLAAIGFLTGLAHEELSPRELAAHDARFPLIVAIRAVKRCA
jgi:SAM-dependent methyltransferase